MCHDVIRSTFGFATGVENEMQAFTRFVWSWIQNTLSWLCDEEMKIREFRIL
jgi:hypothetical protein